MFAAVTINYWYQKQFCWWVKNAVTTFILDPKLNQFHNSCLMITKCLKNAVKTKAATNDGHILCFSRPDKASINSATWVCWLYYWDASSLEDFVMLLPAPKLLQKFVLMTKGFKKYCRGKTDDHTALCVSANQTVSVQPTTLTRECVPSLYDLVILFVLKLTSNQY